MKAIITRRKSFRMAMCAAVIAAGLLDEAALLPAAADGPIAPAAPSPVAVKIDAPSTAIAGEKLYFTLEESGLVRSRIWSVLPAGSVGFDQRDGGARADFATRFAGTYVFVVSVAGADGSVAHAFHSLELREADRQAGQSPSAAANMAPSAAANMAPIAAAYMAPSTAANIAPSAGVNTAPRAADPAELILAWARRSPAGDRRAEAAMIARALRLEAEALASERNRSGDALADVRAACAMSLGPRYAAWAPFFDQLEWFYVDMARRGLMPSRANRVAALESTAKVLEAF